MRFIFAVIIFCLWTFSAQAAEKLKIVASFSIWADIAEQIGGDQVEVYTLVKPGGDAHAYEPSPQDVVKLQLADVIILNGLGFEPVLMRVIQAQQLQNKVLVVSQNIEPLTLAADNQSANSQTPDPHIWHDPRHVAQVVASIAQQLTALRPAQKPVFTKRAADLNQEILALHRWAQTQFGPIQVTQRRILTAHDAFQYFANTYQLTLLPLQGLSTNQEPNPQHISAIVKQVKAGQVRAIFLEKGTNPKLLQALSAEANVPVNGTLYADSLSDAQGVAAHWQDMFRYNVKTVTAALQQKN